MKFRIAKHYRFLWGWAIVEDENLYLSKKNNGNVYEIFYRGKLVDSPEIIRKKFNASDSIPFLFENKEDAEKFLEYLEPIIIMEKLMGSEL